VLTTNNEFAAAAVRNVLYIWDAQTGSLVNSFDDHFARITALLSVSNSHVNNVISVSLDRTIKVLLIHDVSRSRYCIAQRQKLTENVVLGLWDNRI